MGEIGLTGLVGRTGDTGLNGLTGIKGERGYYIIISIVDLDNNINDNIRVFIYLQPI